MVEGRACRVTSSDEAVAFAGQFRDLGAEFSGAVFTFRHPLPALVDFVVECVDGVAVAEPRPRAVEAVELMLGCVDAPMRVVEVPHSVPEIAIPLTHGPL